MAERPLERKNGGRGGAGPSPPRAAGSGMPSLRRDVLLAASVATIALAAYANSIGNGFVYDDMSAIEAEPRLNSPGIWDVLLHHLLERRREPSTGP